MKPALTIIILLLSGCETSSGSVADRPGELEIAIAGGVIGDRVTSGSRPGLIVSLTNRTGGPLCIAAEALQNPYTEEVDLRLRDTYGRPVGTTLGGYPLPPLPGTVRVDPGATVIGRYTADSRFKRIRDGEPVPRGWSARVTVRYGDCQLREAYCEGRIGPCPDSWSRRAVSDWQVL